MSQTVRTPCGSLESVSVRRCSNGSFFTASRKPGSAAFNGLRPTDR